MAPRRCTDPICVIVFFVFLAGMGDIVRYALLNGNLRRLSHGIDYKGEICGVSENVTTQPYLFWCRDTSSPGASPVGMPTALRLDRPVCISDCPTVFTEQVLCPTQDQVTIQSVPTSSGEEDVTTIVSSLVLKDAYPSRVVGHRYCMPEMAWNATMKNEVLQGLDNDYVSQAITASSGLRQVPQVMIGVGVGAVVLAFLYLVLLRLFPKFLVWGSIAVISLLLLAMGGAFLATAFNVTGHQAISPIYQMHSAAAAFNYSVVLGGICLGFAFLFLCFTCCVRTSIEHAVDAVEASTECIFHLPSLLVSPMPFACIKACILAVALYGFLLLVSCGDLSSQSVTVGDTTVTGMGRSFTYSDEQQGFLVYYVFVTVWVLELVSALNQFAVAYAVALWFYSDWDLNGNKITPYCAVPRGMVAGLTFHLGSLIFGSCVVTAIKCVKWVLMLIARAAKAEDNKVAACIVGCCACCMQCMETTVAFVSRTAYVDIALNSKPYCRAAREAAEFMAGHATDVAVLTGATFVLSALGCSLVAALGGFSTWMLLSTQESFTSDTSPNYVEEPEFVAGVAAFVCFTVAVCFLEVLDQTAETLLFVFAVSVKDGNCEQFASDSHRAWIGEPPAAKEEAKAILSNPLTTKEVEQKGGASSSVRRLCFPTSGDR